MLKKVQICQEEIDREVYDQIIEEAESDAKELGAESNFDVIDWGNCHEKSRDLYKLRMGKLNGKLLETARLIPGRNGFETLRRIVQEEDPTLGNSDFAMSLDLQKLSFARARSRSRIP